MVHLNELCGKTVSRTLWFFFASFQSVPLRVFLRGEKEFLPLHRHPELVVRSPVLSVNCLVVNASRFKRRDRYNIPKLSCPAGVDPDFLDCFAMLAMTIKRSPIERDEPIAKASGIMQERKIRHIAVTDKGKIVGILSVKDLKECWTNWR